MTNFNWGGRGMAVGQSDEVTQLHRDRVLSNRPIEYTPIVYQLSSAQVLPWFYFGSTSLRSACVRAVTRLRSFIGAPSEVDRYVIEAASDKRKTRSGLGRALVGINAVTANTIFRLTSDPIRPFFALSSSCYRVGIEWASNGDRVHPMNIQCQPVNEGINYSKRAEDNVGKYALLNDADATISTEELPERYCKGTGKVLNSGGKGTGEVLESYQRGTKEILTGSRSVVGYDRDGDCFGVVPTSLNDEDVVNDVRMNRLFLRGFRSLCEEFRCKVESMAVSENKGRQIGLNRALLKTVSLMIFCVLFSSLVCLQAVAQTQSELVLQGEVRSAADGRTIEGASVKVDNKYARTDKQGKFTIAVDKSTGVLLIKHIGYKEQRVAYENTSTIINIRLQPNANTIEEVDVVSTGYQKIDKNNTPGSIVKIDSGLLNLSISGSLTERLQNISPSFLVSNTVEGNKRIQIRGMYALRENVAKPLIILDNFPYEGELDDINPDEIESVNILRDASAAAIWGARAGNGVIVLNSRRANKNGFKLQLQTNTSIQARPDLMSNSQILPSRDFLAFEQYKFSLNYGLSDTADYRKPALSPLYELLLGKQKGMISEAQMEAQLHKWSLTDLRDEYEKHVYQNQIVNRYNISLQHGSTAHMTMLNLGLENDTRDIVGNSGQRISVLLNNTLKPLPFLEIDLGVRFFRQKSILNGLLGYGQLQVNGKLLPPYLSFYNEQGEANEWDIYYRKEFTDLAGQAKLLDWKYRPLEDVGLLDRWSAQNNLLADLGLRFRLTPASLLQLSYRGESTSDQYHYYYPKESYYTRNLINTFTKIEQGTPVYQLPNEGMLDQNNGSGFRHFLRGQYNFDRRHGKHAFNAILGGEISLGQDRSNKNRVYGYNTKLNHASVPYNVLIPSYANVAGYLYIPYIDDLSQIDNRNLSFYGNAHYGWDGKYIVSASARRDASNLFGVNTNQKWKPLWSVGGLWKIQEESFFRLPLSVLELRATYGKSGNINRSVSALPTIMYYPASSQLTQLPYTGILGGYNPDLKWEEVNTLNFGINIASKGRRWKGSVEYYFKNARDVIADEPVDNTIGYTSSPKNSAHIDGRGLDISLDVDVVRGNSWRWQIIANHSIAKYKVSKYLGAEVDKYIGYVGDGSSISILEGYNPYTLVSYRWGGLRATDGSPLGFVDGEISDDYEKLINRPFHEQSLSGSAIPLSFGNVLNRISYKRIDLSFNISYKLGHYFRKNSISYEKAFLNNNIHSDYLLRWQNEGDEAKTVVPSMLYPLDNRRDQFYLNSDINVLNGANVRLNDIRLSYTVHIDPLKKRRVPIALFANLNQVNWILWRANSEDIDPDYKDGYLPPKQWSFGMKMNF
ncbi:TonB-linked outer membrane protein, SusC/RagA family [Sphingobacterium nematocida]|uniref:TonB-linked outer membrane protein, SusC/RagA family n=1 Tax=Sphingobacterium nematocida TaxID=1513896 RepID=A0A1T5D8L6_9SPHI|nr:SusC/RagA family TonB-linked outer membrane protein [Sphingobacterium nematocida]SKB68009.1 TonB-linked outer membrane protein, SusC/RagA family [Sphingobacterium nematocida]